MIFSKMAQKREMYALANATMRHARHEHSVVVVTSWRSLNGLMNVLPSYNAFLIIILFLLAAEITQTVKRFYLTENKLQKLGTFLQLTQIAEVQMARNLISFLAEEDFKGVHDLSALRLQGNEIRRIDELTFLAIGNHLHYLDLSSNIIKHLNGSVKFLSQLMLLNLTNNLIKVRPLFQ